MSGLSTRYAATSSCEAGFDLSLRHCNAKTMPDGLTRDDAPVPSTAPTLDLDCYLAMRKTANQLGGDDAVGWSVLRAPIGWARWILP